MKASYVPPSLIVGDSGTWEIGDTVCDFPEDCGEDHNRAEIVEQGGNKMLQLTSVYHPSTSHPGTACAANNVWAVIGSIQKPLLIPINVDTMMAFTESGSLIDPVWNDFWPVIHPPAGDVVALRIEASAGGVQSGGSILVYIFQRAPDCEPNTDKFSNVGYHEILIGEHNSQGGTHLRIPQSWRRT